MKGKKVVLSLLLAILCLSSYSNEKHQYDTISKAELNNKIKGAWAGKMIGVVKGIGMEFQAGGHHLRRFSIMWYPRMIKRALLEDDIYGQLGFMDTMVKNQGLKTPVAKLAEEFANAEFNLCHANLQARKNFLDGIMPPLSGAPAYNMHANDIDFQIESDYIGFIQTVIDGYGADVSDWRSTWEKVQERWGESDLCVPYHPFNIDATINGAFIAMGLVFGENDLERTIEIAIRCGQDTDCNAANAAAVLGIIQGYDAIDENLKSHIPEIASSPFLYTDISFEKAVSLTLLFAEENILTHGGSLKDEIYRVKQQTPFFSGQLEQSFSKMVMAGFIQMSETNRYRLQGNREDFRYGGGDNDLYKVFTSPGDTFEMDFTGSGISVLGSYNTDGGSAMAYIDGDPSGSSIAITARKQVNGMATGNTSSTKWILQMETTH